MRAQTQHPLMPTAHAAPDQEYEVSFREPTRFGAPVAGQWFGGRSSSGHWLVQRPDGGQTISGVPDDELVILGLAAELD